MSAFTLHIHCGVFLQVQGQAVSIPLLRATLFGMSSVETGNHGAVNDVLFLSTATCMAACSFEAYLEPTVGTSCQCSTTGLSVTNSSVGGTSVQYVDASIVHGVFSQAMLLHVSSACAALQKVRSSGELGSNHALLCHSQCEFCANSTEAYTL